MATPEPAIEPLTRIARRLGIIGIVAVVAGWGSAVLFVHWTGLYNWPAWASLLAAGAYGVLAHGVPVLGTVLVAFWIGARVWSRRTKPTSEAPDDAR